MTAPASGLTPEAQTASAFHGIERRETIQEEQPYHRQAALMFALGASTRDVADAQSVTTGAARSWLRQPWFQERVIEFQRQHGGRDLTQLFINEALATLGTMLQLRDNPKTPPAVTRGVCSDILDRAFGKPKQYVETTLTQSVDDPVAEAERLELENAKLQSSRN